MIRLGLKLFSAWSLAIFAVGCSSGGGYVGPNFKAADARQAQRTEALQHVNITMNADDVKGCQSVGMVDGTSYTEEIVEGGISAYKKPYYWDAKGEVAEKAVGMSANAVLIGAGSTPTKLLGQAYACSKREPAPAKP